MVVSLPAEIKLYLPLAVPRCRECDSPNLVQTEDGYVACGECGLVCDDLPLMVSDPIAKNGGFLSSHAVSQRGFGTIVGSTAEREQSSDALQRGARLARPDYLTTLRARGHAAIKRILGLVGGEQQEIVANIASRLFWQFYALMPKGSNARNVDALATAAIYRAATQARVAINLRRLVTAGLPDPRLRSRFMAILKNTAPLCAQLGTEERLLIAVRDVVNTAGITPRTALLAGKLARKHARCFPSPKVPVSAAAIVHAASICTGEGVSASRIAAAAGVAESAVLRCTRTAVRRREKADLGALPWGALKSHVQRLFGDSLRQAAVPLMVDTGAVPAGAATVTGYVAAEVESPRQPARDSPGCDPASLQAATVAAGLIEHQRPGSQAAVESILARVAAAARHPATSIARALIKVITVSRVFPAYILPETLILLLEAGFPPALSRPTGEGPPAIPGS